MSEFPPESLEVAVTVVRRGDRVLAGYNSSWGAFTLPMTKRRKLAKPDDPQMTMSEPWDEAAVRNVVEWFGVTLTGAPTQLLEIREFRQSDRDLIVKNYHFEVFELRPADEQSLIESAVAEWLLPDQFLEVKRRPISPTARFLIEELQSKGKL